MNLRHPLRGPDDGGAGSTAGTGTGDAAAVVSNDKAGSGSDGKDAGGGASQTTGDAGSAATSGAGAGQQLSLLAQATGATPPGTAAADGKVADAAKVARSADVPAWVPEKFKTGEDFVKSYGELEKRMKDVGLPPKVADEYKWTPPAGLKMDEGGSKEFREFALGLGLTQKQYEGVMGAYVEHLGQAGQDMLGFAADKSALELRKLPGWESDAGFQYNLAAAGRALNTFMPPEKVAQFEAINHPAVWELLATLGREIGEDRGMHGGALIQAGDTKESLQAMPAYKEMMKTGKHTPESQQITNRLTALFEREAAANRGKLQ